MNLQTNKKSVVAMTIFAVAFVANTACTKKAATDAEQTTITVEERIPTQEEYQKALIASEPQVGNVPPVTVEPTPAPSATPELLTSDEVAPKATEEDVKPPQQEQTQAPDSATTPRAVESPQTSHTFKAKDADRATIAGISDLLDVLPNLGPEAAQVAAFGKAIWKLLEDNQPVITIKKNQLSVMPKNINDWSRMSGFSTPKVRAYTVSIKNLYGVEVVRYDYAISFSHSGSLNGKGRYLQNITVINSYVNVLWGWNLDADFVAGEITNAGTPENPVPAVQAEIRYKVKTVTNKRQVADAFWIAGDGRIIRLDKSRD